MTDLMTDATVTCREDPWVGIEWWSEQDPLPVAPVHAVAEWLRRRPCEVCGGTGCVEVSAVSLYADTGDDDDPIRTVESFDTYGDPPS